MLYQESATRRKVIAGAFAPVVALVACTYINREAVHLGKDHHEVLKSFPVLADNRVYEAGKIDLDYGQIAWFNFAQDRRLLTDNIQEFYNFLVSLGQRKDLRYGTPDNPVTFWNYDANTHHLFLIPQDSPPPVWHPQGQPQPPAATYFFDNDIFATYIRSTNKPLGAYRSADEMVNAFMAVEAGQSVFKPVFPGAADNKEKHEFYREGFNNSLGWSYILKQRGVTSYNNYLAEMSRITLYHPSRPTQPLTRYTLFRRDFERLPTKPLVETKW